MSWTEPIGTAAKRQKYLKSATRPFYTKSAIWTLNLPLQYERTFFTDVMDVDADNNKSKGGRRKDPERRNYSYTVHIPERRSGNDRRDKKDRRKVDRQDADPEDATKPLND